MEVGNRYFSNEADVKPPLTLEQYLVLTLLLGENPPIGKTKINSQDHFIWREAVALVGLGLGVT